MANEVYINANEFIESLKAQGLCIVSVKDFESGKEIIRRRLMRRKVLSVKEIIDHELLPLNSKNAVMDWIEKGKIRPDEVIREEGGKNKVLILTSALYRLGYGL